jgi:hypothetical protein
MKQHSTPEEEGQLAPPHGVAGILSPLESVSCMLVSAIIVASVPDDSIFEDARDGIIARTSSSSGGLSLGRLHHAMNVTSVATMLRSTTDQGITALGKTDEVHKQMSARTSDCT